MTKAEIDAVLDRVRTWSPDRQAYAAAVLLTVEREGTGPHALTDEEAKALDEAEEQEARGDFASDEDVEALFDRSRPS